MADWKFPPDAAVDPDAPVTSDLMYSLRDNPVAIAEGAAGAPKVSGAALAGVYLNTISVSGTSPNGIVGIPRTKNIMLIVDYLTTNNAAGLLQIRFTNDDGVSWGGWSSLTPNISGTAPYVIHLTANIDVSNGSFHTSGMANMSGNSLVTHSGTVTTIVGFTGFQLRLATASGNFVAHCYRLGGIP